MIPICSVQGAWARLPGRQREPGYAYEKAWMRTKIQFPRPQRRIERWLQLYNRMIEEGEGLEHNAPRYLRGDIATKFASRDYKTQKVNGILALAFGHCGYTQYSVAYSPQVLAVLQNPEDLAPFSHAVSPSHFPVFARPCPVTPQHGFVDSVPARNPDYVIDVFLEAKAADPDAEVLIMPVLSARYSGVITTVGVAIGFGNAGVTSGEGMSYFVPAPASLDKRMSKIGINAKITTSPYIEFVENDMTPCLVQLRDGPKLVGASPDWVPKATQVKHVLRGQEIGQLTQRMVPLLTWQKRLEALSPEEKKGTVVNLEGMTLASHYAVQAITHEIPVITSRSVVVGDQLKPSSAMRAKAAHAPDYREIATNLTSRLGHPLTPKYGSDWPLAATLLVMGVAHAHATWPGGVPHLNALRGQAVALAIRLGMTVCLGESRHYREQCTPSGKDLPFLPIHLGTIGVGPEWVEGGESNVSRNKIFDWGLTCDLHTAAVWTVYALEMFNANGWHSNFGGVKWARIAAYTLDLLAKAQAFVCRPNKATWARTARALDLVADAVHNSGYAFSKFVAQSTIKLVVEEPVWGFILPLPAEIILGRVQARPWKRLEAPPPAVRAFQNMAMKEIPHVETLKKVLEEKDQE